MRPPKSWLLVEAGDWVHRAACTGSDVAWFFGDSAADHAAAKAVCAGCEVSAECLSYALVNEEEWGVWGGLTTPERRARRRRLDRVMA